MKTHPGSWRFRMILLLPAILLLACSFSIPFLQSNGSGEGTGAKQIPLPGGSETLADPMIGLASLKSYHVSFHQDITGTLDGKPFERHTHIELARASGQSDFLHEFQGTDELTSYFHAIGTGQAAYRWNTLDETCQGTVGEVFPEENVDPAELLLPILQTSKVGAETINQIPAMHYHFDQNGLPLTEPKPSVTGEIWLAEQGGYLVKYTLSAAMPSKITGSGLEVAQTWTYELSQVNTVDSIALPNGCMAVPVDIPAMPDATDVSRSSGMMEYTTASSAFQVVDFYYHHLDSLGWTTKQSEPTGELKVPLGLSFLQGDLVLAIDIDKADGGGLDVTLVISNPKEQPTTQVGAATPTAEFTITPAGPQPTVASSQSGLPADVPLYPGATGLAKPSSQVVQFETSDTPDQVDQYYQQQMPAQKWTLLNSIKQGVNIIQAWQKDKRVVTIAITPQAGKTIVIIAFPNS